MKNSDINLMDDNQNEWDDEDPDCRRLRVRNMEPDLFLQIKWIFNTNLGVTAVSCSSKSRPCWICATRVTQGDGPSNIWMQLIYASPVLLLLLLRER